VGERSAAVTEAVALVSPARRGSLTGAPRRRCSVAQRGLHMPRRIGEGGASRVPWGEGLGKAAEGTPVTGLPSPLKAALVARYLAYACIR
jgi:hypothetical protein